MMLAFVREIYFVLWVIWYALWKASFVIKGFQSWVPASTLVYVFYLLIH